ncbi:MAG: hypothetical protein P8X42_14935 [Calditrichaceae bacterium]|jgi:hypothetical protein
MKTQSLDTPTSVEKIQLSLLKKQSMAQKFASVCSLSQTTMELSKRAIRRKNRNFDDKQINLSFIRLQYGDDLAIRVREYLNR